MSVLMLGIVALVAVPDFGHAAGEDTKPYDDKLLRLSEVLGAVHFLRELCGAEEGQVWRQQMADLVEADAGSVVRRVRLTNGFNKGYRSYRRTYQTCNTGARAQIGRFLIEGADLAKALADYKP
jgi:uncharacterized protein (TIGR02301 family)